MESQETESLLSLTEALSPIVGIRVGLRFGRDAAPGLFHQPALTAMLRTLMDGGLARELLLWVQATESGRAFYARGESYCFNVFAARPAHARLMRLIERLPHFDQHLPGDQRVPFGASMEFEGLFHPLDQTPLRPATPVTVFSAAHLVGEVERFRSAPQVRVRLLAPLRVLRDKQERGAASGDARYVHDADQLAPLLLRRAHDSLLEIARHVEVRVSRPETEPTSVAVDVFHIDWDYRDGKGRTRRMGGMLGWLDFDVASLADGHLEALLLAQRLGIGQRRTFGWGALRLETPEGQGVVPPRCALNPMFERAGEHENLRQAFRESIASAETPKPWRGLGRRTLPDDALDWLHDLHEDWMAGDYEPPPLHGRVLMPDDGRLRPLAVPPWSDRLMQRAVARVLTGEVETIFNPASFGYRRGRSRHQVRDHIESLYRAGYRFCFEADISAFFDQVEHARVDTRLRGLLGDDPIIEPLLHWLACPVEYQGRRIVRVRGLPQGSPLSPVLANMLLEDLDADCQAHGLQLLRYADDFVVLCRSEEEAQAAWRRAEESVDELGLMLKPAKTGIRELGDGGVLEFLGFKFIGDLSIEHKRPPPKPGTRIKIPPRSWLAELIEAEPELEQELQAEWDQRHHPKPKASRRSLLAGEQNQAAEADPTDSRASTLLHQEEATTDPNESPRRSLLAGEPNQAAEADPTDSRASTLLQEDVEPDRIEQPPAATQPGEGSLLCITEPALLAQRQGQLLVLTDREGGRQYPWSELQAVLVFGLARMTSGAVGAALDHGVPIHFLGGRDGYQGRLIAAQYNIDDLDLALAQRELFADDALAMALARRLVMARLHNQRELLRQRLRGASTDDQALMAINAAIEQANEAKTRQSLNGIEGAAARAYFQALATTLPDWLEFTGRNRRPPRDPFNALLSLGFTIMYSRTIGLAHVAGFHPRIGFYHQPHGRHAVLASDLMEPFRHLVERTACTVLKRGELKQDDFALDDERGCRLEREALKRYLTRLSEAMARATSASDAESGNFYQHMHRQLKSLDRLRRGVGDLQPWFYRMR